MPDGSAAFALAEAAAFFMLERKAENVVILDLRGRAEMCDFFVLGDGMADVQVRAVAESVRDGTAGRGEKVHHVEGLNEGRWVLLDYIDVVVHVFKPEVRGYYQLERLWGDAPRLPVTIDHYRDPEVQARQVGLPGLPPPVTREDASDGT
ncbi:MAG: ribosome silencing factor [Candidatus Krumholzibacteriia bacterium]